MLGKLAVVCVAALAVLVYSEEFESKPAVRIIPADVLRDFPDKCFASTQCRLYKPNDTWSLAPFCGFSKCIQHFQEGVVVLLEEVSDCGPPPREIPEPKEGSKPKCKISEAKTNPNATYPSCCPVYDCEQGAELVFPKIGGDDKGPGRLASGSLRT